MADLVDLVVNPARTFLRDRLGVAVPREAEETSDRMPIAPDALDLWAIGDRALRSRLAGRPAADVWNAEFARGELPPGELGKHTLRPVSMRVEEIVAWVEAHRGGAAPRTVDVLVDLPGARRLTGAVEAVVIGPTGTALHDVNYGAAGAKPELRAWVRLLALTVALAEGHPGAGEGPPTATVVGSGRRGIQGCTLGPVPPELAADLLADLLALDQLARTAPLPLPAKTGREWAQAIAGSGGSTANRRRLARQRAGEAWEGGNFPGERVDRWWRLIHGDASTLADLLADAAGPGTGLADLAPRLWEPLLEHRGPLR